MGSQVNKRLMKMQMRVLHAEHSKVKYNLVSSSYLNNKIFNSSTPKVLLLILPAICYTFPIKLVTRIWY